MLLCISIVNETNIKKIIIKFGRYNGLFALLKTAVCWIVFRILLMSVSCKSCEGCVEVSSGFFDKGVTVKLTFSFLSILFNLIEISG